MSDLLDILRRLHLHGKVRFPSPGKGTGVAQISRLTEPLQLPPIGQRDANTAPTTWGLVLQYSETDDHQGTVHYRRTVLLEHVAAIAACVPNSTRSINEIPDRDWLFGEAITAKALNDGFFSQQDTFNGFVLVVEEAPLLVESNIKEAYVAFAAEEAGDTPAFVRSDLLESEYPPLTHVSR